MRLSRLALVAPALFAFSFTALAQPVGEATKVQRFAYQTPQQGQRAPLFPLGKVVRNARLETVPSGGLEVKFIDGSRLTMGSASSIIVDNYVYAGDASTNTQAVKMTKGLFRFVSGSMPKDKVKLQTPAVTIGIRGTEIKILVKDDGSGTIFFMHGQGNVTNGKGQNVEMGEGDMVKIGADGSITPPKKVHWDSGEAIIDQGFAAFNQQFNGANGGSGGGDGAGSSSSNRPGNAAAGD